MTLYRMKYESDTLKDYCDNLRQEAALIQRDIEKLQVKRETLQELSYRLEKDFIPALREGDQLSADKQAKANLGSCVKGEV